MKNRFIIFLGSLMFLLGAVFPVYALSTPSDADYNSVDDYDALDYQVASSSNAVNDFISNNWIQLYSSGDDFKNNINLSDCYVQLVYYDMHSVLRIKQVMLSSDGKFSFSMPDDFVSCYAVYFVLGSGALPPSGKYNMKFSFSSYTGGFTYSSPVFNLIKDIKNSSSDLVGKPFEINQYSGNFDFNMAIDLSGANRIQMNILVSGLVPPFGGVVKAQFSPTKADANVTGPSVPDGQVQDNISNNTGIMVEQQETIIEQIVNVTETISSQLTAFWNQLAGEFTNLYSKMNMHHQEDLNAVQNQTDEITSNQDTNTNREIANEDKNTNILVGALEKLGNFIIDGLKSLFIPSDTFFKTYFDDLLSWFSDRFGFLSFPIELLVKLVNLFVNSSDVDCVLTLPSFSVSGQQLWGDMSFNLTEFLEINFMFLLVAIRTVSSIYLIMSFVHLCEEKWDEVMLN